MCESLVVNSGPPLAYSNFFAIEWEPETKWPLFQRLVCLFYLFQMALGYDSSNMFARNKVKNGFMGFFIYSAFRHYKLLSSSQHKIRSTNINHSAPGIAAQQSHQDL